MDKEGAPGACTRQRRHWGVLLNDGIGRVSISPAVAGWLAPARLLPYLKAAREDPDKALQLYLWNTHLASACFETVSHVEVILRHAMDVQLSHHFQDEVCGIPWFLRPIAATQKAQSRIDDDIETVRRRVRDLRRETRDQIIAGLSFGFWANLLHSDHEQLWRDCLSQAFPGSSGRRKDVAAVVEPLRVFRNRLAHHDSLLSINVIFQRDQLLRLAGWIDPTAAAWVSANERITEVYGACPMPRPDTVVVAAGVAWDLYQATHAYVCQAGRAVRATDDLAFYTDREIKPEVPKILGRQDNLPWGSSQAQQLAASVNPDDQRLAQVMTASIDAGWTEGRYQVFMLTAPGEKGHITLPKPIPHRRRGTGSAFVQGQRYASHQQLLIASSTDDSNTRPDTRS